MTEPVVLDAGGTSAGIDPVGGGIAWCRVGGVDIVERRAAGEAGRFCTGSVLFPWPNRVRGARWRQGGVEHRLDVTEPERGHANHGLVLGTVFRAVEAAGEAVCLSAPVGPAAGYPFVVQLVVRYAVYDDGLDVRYSATNLGPEPAPAAIGAHPYLRIGDVPATRLMLQLPVASRFTLDAGLIPVAEGPLTGDHARLPAGLPLGERLLNECYTRTGSSPARLVAPDGSAVELEADDDFAFLQIFVTDEFPGEAGPRQAVAVEPMTAPPDALNSGRGLHWLAPGEEWTAGWRLRYRPA